MAITPREARVSFENVIFNGDMTEIYIYIYKEEQECTAMGSAKGEND
jgi:hypothetical protein